MKLPAFAFATVLLSVAPASAALQIAHTRCEDYAAPLGVDVPQPRLTWVLQSAERGAAQSAYRVLAASSPALLARDEGDLWDSGRIASADSVGVPYAGRALASAQQVFWKVQVWDGAGAASAWSEPAAWTMGVLRPEDWQAQWIAAPAAMQQVSLMLRREFDVGPDLRRAVVFVCGLGQYEMTFNGKKAGDALLAPGWTIYEKTCLYDTYDVTALLAPGRNTAGLLLGNGMYNVSPRVTGARYARFHGPDRPLTAIALLRLEYADGRVETVGTDAQWHVAPGPITFGSVYGGEDYDALKDPLGWREAGYREQDWAAAAVVAGPGGQLRGLSCAGPAIRAFEVLPPVNVTELKPNVYVYDFGQNAAILPQLSVGGSAGAVVRMIPGELLRADGSVDPASSRTGDAWWQYTLRGGDIEEWRPRFFYNGCRYLQVELSAPYSGDLPEIQSLEAVVIHADARAVGEFSSANELLGRIRTLVRWAQRSNLMSVLTGSPHREKLGWLEQTYLNGPSLRYEFDLAPLAGKMLNDMADSQTAEGLVPDTSPELTVFAGDFRDSPEWGSAVIQVPWQQYEWTGSPELLARFYPTMTRYAAYLQGKSTDGLLRHGRGDWFDFGPGPLGKAQLTPPALSATATYYADLQILERTAELLKKPADAAQFAAQAQAVAAAFDREFWNAAAGGYGPGSQTANAMPLALGLVAPERRARVLENLVADVQKNALTAGDIGHAYLLRALAEGGRADVIYALHNQSAKPGYGYQLAKGATALTEAWSAAPELSQNHLMLGHIVEWFYRGLAGIAPDPAGPGFRKIIFRPQVVGDLAWVKASYDSVRGPVAASWQREGASFTYEISLPPGATATVHLPAGDAAAVRESGGPAASQPGVKFLRNEAGAAVFEVESGAYNFTSALPAP